MFRPGAVGVVALLPEAADVGVEAHEHRAAVARQPGDGRRGCRGRRIRAIADVVGPVRIAHPNLVGACAGGGPREGRAAAGERAGGCGAGEGGHGGGGRAARGFVRVVARGPDACDAGPEAHVERASIGGNTADGGRGRGRRGVGPVADVVGAGGAAHPHLVGGGAGVVPGEGRAGAGERGARGRTGERGRGRRHGRARGFVRVVARGPDACDAGPEAHVERASIGGNAADGGRGRG